MITIHAEALEVFGEEAQIKVVFGELAELQDAICKWYRSRATREKVVEERVDVKIVLGYIDEMFGITEAEIAEYEQRKIARIRNLIEQKRSTINGE